MSVLLVLTLVYVAILILVLAIGLLAIVFFLNSARANLARIANGLKEVDKNVEPLRQALTTVNDGLGALLTPLQQVKQHLPRAVGPQEERRAS